MKLSHAVIGSVAFFVLAPGTIAGWVPWSLSRWHIGAPLLGVPALRGAGIAVIIGGVAVLLDSFARFAFKGLGTPSPVLPTQHLVVGGIYRYVRNPMYVAVVATIIGQGLLFGSTTVLVYGALVWVAMHLFVLAYEEPTLRRTYGIEYDRFCAEVPRWIPRVPRASGAASAKNAHR